MTKYHSDLLYYTRPENFSRLSEQDRAVVKEALYLEIKRSDWSPLSKYPEESREELLETRHGLLQALENVTAHEQGRPAKELVFAKPSDPDSYLRDGKKDCSCFGYWSPGEDKIYINDDLVSEGRLDAERGTPERGDVKLQLVDTVVHEGRHAYQSYAIEHPEVNGDTPEARREVESWAKNEGKYYSGELRYYVQPQEADAYSYACDKMEQIFGDDLENESGFAEYESFSRNTEANNVLDAIAYNEGTTKEDVVNKMDKEMISECQVKGIKYTYSDLVASEKARDNTNNVWDTNDISVKDQGIKPEKGASTSDKPEQISAGELREAVCKGAS